MKNRQVSTVVVPLVKAFSGSPPCLGNRVMEPCNLLAAVVQSNERLVEKHWAGTHNYVAS